MAAVDNLSPKDKEFLAECEEELKHRYTDEDEKFMKVFNAEPSTPPIIESWWVSQNSGWGNDRRNDRRNHPYERQGYRDRGYQDRNQDRNRNQHRDRWGNQDRRGYSDYNRGYDRDDRGYRNQRPRY